MLKRSFRTNAECRSVIYKLKIGVEMIAKVSEVLCEMCSACNRILWLVCITFLHSCALEPDDPIGVGSMFSVQTTSGIAMGSEVKAGNESIRQWIDIPYAQPPLGDLRWRAPRELVTPEAIITDREISACVQEASDYGGVKGDGVVGTEDCLYLDIRAPRNVNNRRYPVMFWIHGGGNTTGTKDYYDFSKMVASQDVIVVTVNYRLGPLGWFTHPAIQGGQSNLDASSNYGTLDIIQALRWVKENIGKFGGDENNITIFGESAGGHNVLALLTSPLTMGLFHKAIAQSGYSTSTSLERAYDYGNKDSLIKRGSWRMVNELLSTHYGPSFSQNKMSDHEVRQKLRDTDAKEFVRLYVGLRDEGSMPLTTADGVVIPSMGLRNALESKVYAKNIPVISGTNRDELTLWLGIHRYFMDLSYPLTRLFPPFVKIRDPELYEFWVRVRSHAWKLRAVDDVLLRLDKAGYDNLRAYRFDWDDQKASFFADFPSFIGAAHGTEIAFITGDYKYGPITEYIYPPSAERDQMEITMMSAWAAFAYSSDPTADLAISWPHFTDDRKSYLRLDKDESLVVEDERYDMDSLLEQVRTANVATELEKCTIVWDSLINAGDPDVHRYKKWNQGNCAVYDIVDEQRKVAERLRKEFGSTTIM